VSFKILNFGTYTSEILNNLSFNPENKKTLIP
jgi:hypothetical protein